MMIGVAKVSLPGAPDISATEAVESAAKLGFSSLLFNGILELSPTLDSGELAALKAKADGLGVTLLAGCNWISAGHPERMAAIAALGGGDLVSGFGIAARAAASIGIDHFFFMIGSIADREDPARPWAGELEAAVALLRQIAPVTKAEGVRLLLKTHEEITTAEVLRIVEAVGPDLIGIAFDPVNVLCRIEDPVEAAKRVAPHVALLHVEDAILQIEGDGIRRYLAPIGAGVVDWPTILGLFPDVPAFIELHRGQFAMAVFDQAWVAAQPDLTLSEYVTVVGMAARDRTGPMPWDQSDPASRLPAAQAYLKAIAP